MDNFNLSQEEIDALLRQMRSGGQSGPSVAPALSDADKDVIGEIANISFGSAATSLSHLLGQRVEITTPDVRFVHKSQVLLDFPRPYAAVTVAYTSGLNGTNVFLLELADALTIADLMLGGDGKPQHQEVGELQLSALAEAMNQMMGGAATAMSSVFNRRIDISTPEVRIVDLAGEGPSVIGPDDWLAEVRFRLRVGQLIDSMLIQFIPNSFVQEMLHVLASTSQPATQATSGTVDATMAERPVAQEAGVEVKRPVFADFSDEAAATTEPMGNLDLLLDVPLVVSVELGRTRRQLRELLELGPGAVIELDKLAGEPVDILVNNKRIAIGEVVVIDESFGVRVTDILSPAERATRLRLTVGKPLSGTG